MSLFVLPVGEEPMACRIMPIQPDFRQRPFSAVSSFRCRFASQRRASVQNRVQDEDLRPGLSVEVRARRVCLDVLSLDSPIRLTRRLASIMPQQTHVYQGSDDGVAS